MNTNKIILSIITVCYNSEKTIEKTIKSVLNQNLNNNYEYIIIDGNSTDKTLDIIKKYEKYFIEKNINYEYISEKDHGIYNAMNKGIKKSKGEIIGIINSDDWYQEDIFDSVTKIFFKEKIDVIYGDLNFFKEGLFYKKEGNSHQFLPEKMIGHPTCFIKKSCYEKYNYYDENYKCAADYDFMIKLFIDKAKFKKIDVVLANFNLGGATDRDYTSKYETLNIKKKYNYITFKEYIMKKIELKIKEMIKKIGIKNG